MKLRINKPDDEHLSIELDGTHVISANHDEDGWTGMERIETVARRLAARAGWEVVVTYDSVPE